MTNTDYSTIPAILRDVYKKLEGELLWVHEEWKMYRQLFGSNPERIDLMNEMVPMFIGNLQIIWLDWITLRICRLAADNSKVAGHETLVVALLHENLDRTTHPALGSTLDTAFDEVRRTCGILQDHRHNRIAHLNRATHLNSDAHQMLPRLKIEDALVAVRSYMNAFREAFIGSPLYFEGVIMQDDAETLLYSLLQANEYQKLQRENPGLFHPRLRANKYYACLQR